MSEEEIWKSVPFALLYSVSNLGRIKGKRGRLLSPSINYNGYLVCDINHTQYRMNRVICTTFHGDPPTKDHHAAHKDNDRQNNNSENLYWATPDENGADLAATNKQKGDNNVRSILKEQDVVEIKRLYNEGRKVIGISRKYPQVSYMAIAAIVHGRAWKHVK